MSSSALCLPGPALGALLGSVPGLPEVPAAGGELCCWQRCVLPEGAAVPVSGGTSVISGDRLPVSSREEQMAQSSCGRIVKRFSKLKG